MRSKCTRHPVAAEAEAEAPAVPEAAAAPEASADLVEAEPEERQAAAPAVRPERAAAVAIWRSTGPWSAAPLAVRVKAPRRPSTAVCRAATAISGAPSWAEPPCA